MTRDESLQVTQMVVSGWPNAKEMDREELDLYARSIQDLDAELTTHTVLRAVKTQEFRPTVRALRELVQSEKRKLAPQVAPLEPKEGRPLPVWVKRWICARMLYDQFGKERDLRRFPEQGDYGDLTKEVMPEGAWTAEANSLAEKDFHLAFARMFKS